jgi:PAS domain S-box-containing protein
MSERREPNAPLPAPEGSAPDASSRLAFLARASEELVSAPTHWTALERLAQLIVPALADWCTIDVLDDAGRLTRVAVVHTDPTKIEIATELARRYPPDLDSDYGVPKVLRTGASEIYPDIGEGQLRASAMDDDHLELIHKLGGFRSAMIVPLVARGLTLGAITFVSAEGGRTFTEDDLSLAEALARRGALAAVNARLAEEVEEKERKLENLVDSLDAIVWEADLATRQFTFVSKPAEEILGYPSDRWVKEPEFWSSIVHEADHDRAAEAYRLAAAGDPDQDFEYRMIAADGRTVWIRDLMFVVRGDDGRPEGMRGVMIDITDRVAADRALRDSHERLAFMAEASALLSSSLNYRTVLERLADLVVPSIADWCAVDVLEEDGALRRVAVGHADPAKREVARQLIGIRPDEDDGHVLREVLGTGEAVIAPEGIDACGGNSKDPERRRVIQELGCRTALVVPLVARGRTLGAMTLVTVSGDRTYGPAELTLADDLARRAALAVDNARLYQERSYVARTLQRSLLPPHLPQIPGLDIAARYHAAGEGNEVGGDFYDFFRTAKDDWAIVIGDVCGKGADAAALTALARYTLRAGAMQARKPSRILGMLNEALLSEAAMTDSMDQRFCTVAYIRLRPAGDGFRITSTSGGHPVPLVLHGDGSIEPACRVGTLIGVLPEPSLTDRSAVLKPGDVLLLYTDGIIEGRGPEGVFGEERLNSLIAGCAALDASAIAERIMRAVLDFQLGEPRDDIALMVVRVANEVGSG